MRKAFFTLTIVAVFMATSVFAQVTGETEVGSDGRIEGFLSQYVFIDWKEINVLSRYFYVIGRVNRGELAIGPTISLGPTTAKLQIGGTTDKQLMMSTLVATHLFGRGIMYIFDTKSRHGPEHHQEIYQKLWVALDREGMVLFRYEDSVVGGRHMFVRLGFENSYRIDDKAYFFVAPFYDLVKKNVGAQTGIRFGLNRDR